MNINEKVKQYLLQKKVHVSIEWVEACVQWLQAEHANRIQNVSIIIVRLSQYYS